MTDRPQVETDDVIVLLLGAPGGPGPAGYLQGITRLEKLVFLLERETPVGRWLTEAVEFRSHRFGPFSSKIYKAVGLLARAEMLELAAIRTPGEGGRWEDINVIGEDADPYTERTFQLTERGIRYYGVLLDELKPVAPDAETTLWAFKERYAGLPLTQLVRYVYKAYPNFTDKSEIREQILSS